jgi:hypothetical protein
VIASLTEAQHDMSPLAARRPIERQAIQQIVINFSVGV